MKKQATTEMLDWKFGGRRLIIRGRGPSQPIAWRIRKMDPGAVEWCMNGYRSELAPSAMWDIHCPRHHDLRAFNCPLLLHPETNVHGLAANEYVLPKEPYNCSCTLAWMLAYAFALRPLPTEIILAGCDYYEGSIEDRNERPSVEYWLGRLSLVVELTIPPRSRLCSAGGYR